MGSCFQSVAIILIVLKVLKADDLPDDTEACSNNTVISDHTRLFHYSQTLYNCDADLEEGWYKFEVNGAAAQIPRICLKNNICGTRLPLRLDLGDQSLPTPNATVWAHVCTSFDILDKWDCCVLRQRAGIKNCGDYFVYHLRPTDRCDVAYCTQETGTNPSKEYTAKTGDFTHESMSLEALSASVTSAASYVNTSQAMAGTTSQTENPCPQSLGFPCSKDGSRTCYNSTNDSGRHVMLVECSDGRGCGEACDNIGDCYDDSDEHVNLCLSVICNEAMQLCPDGRSCFVPCDGRRDCNNGSDEQGCWQTLESPSAEPTSQTDTDVGVTETIPSYSGNTLETFPTATIPLSSEVVSSTTVLLSDPSSVTQSISFTDSELSVYQSSSISTSRNSEPSFQTLESITPSFTNISPNDFLLTSTNGLTIVPNASEILSTSTAPVSTIATSPPVQPAGSSEVSASITSEISSPIIRSSILETSSEEITGAERTSLTTRGIVSSVIPTTASGTTTADTLFTGPIILTFDIIGTAYRNVEDTFEEPTFEELLQEAIAGVLNEYTNRNRRSVQNFTEDDIEVQNMTFHTDNATVSVKVNSTKDGEEYVPASELETVFNNQSAMELLCQKLFGESSMQTVAVTSSPDVKPSPLMSSSTAQSTPSTDRVLQVSSQISSLMTSIQPSFTSFTEGILPTAPVASVSREPSSVSSGIILESIVGSDSITQSTPSVTSNILSSLPLQIVQETQITTTTSAEINVYNHTVTVTESPSEIQQFDNLTLTASFSTLYLSAISRAVQTVGSETPPTRTTTLLSDTLEPSPATTITSLEVAQTLPTEMKTTVLPDTLEPSAAPIINSSEVAQTVQTETTTPVPPDTLEPSPATIITSSEVVQTVEIEMTPIVPSSIPEPSLATVAISHSKMSSITPTPVVSVYLSEATSHPSSSVSIQLTTSQLSSSVTTASAYLATSDSAAALLSAATPTVEHSSTLASSETIFKMHSKSSSLLMIQSATTEYSQVLSDTFVKSSSESSSPLVTQSAAHWSSGTEEYLGITPSSPYSSPTTSAAHSMFSQSYTTSVTPLETETSTSSVRLLETETHTIPVTSIETETYTTPVTPSETETYTTPITSLETETYEVPSKDNTTTSTHTLATSTERNLIVRKPDIVEDEDIFQQNIGLFIFLIVGGACIVGAFLFALVGTIYRRRRHHTWDPRMAYQDAYADMEKANLSFHRDDLGIESPIPDIDILKGEPTEQETSLSKASTMTLPPTPKNEASQTDASLDAGPSEDSRQLNKEYPSTSPRYDSTTPDQAGSSGCENRGFEEDRDSGVDGIVPVDEIDNTYPRKEFPWIEQLADTRL